MDNFVTSYPDPAPLSADHLDATGYRSALGNAQQALGNNPLPPLDVVIHGVRVRLHTNSVHWREFWSGNWYTPSQWAALTGTTARDEPKVQLYASAVGKEETPWAGYSLAHTTGFLTGDTPYGPLRSLALGAVAHWLAGEEAVHFVPGLCLMQNEECVVLLDAPDVDRSATAALLMANAKTHLIAFDGVFIRYGLVRMVDGATMLPTQVIDEQGVTTRGYRLFSWLDDYGFDEPRADTLCLDLQGEQEYCFSRDLDLGRAPDAMAFPPEKAWYVPTSIVAADPDLIGALWPDSESQGRALLENVPPLKPDLSARYGQWATETASALLRSANPVTRSLVEQVTQDKIVEALCRLRAAPAARALVFPERLWSGRAGGKPWHSVRIEHIILPGSPVPAPLTASAMPDHLANTGAYLSGLYEDEANTSLTAVLGRAISEAKSPSRK